MLFIYYNEEKIPRQRFHSITLMKGIAILLIILVHTSQRIDGDMLLRPLASYGQMGVQIFFVASAFTLSYSSELRSGDTLKKFYSRRLSRVAPGYYFGIVLYFILTSIFPGVWTSSKNPLNITINFLFLHGIYPPANNSVVPGGWSIGTEMLFYLVFPFLFSKYIQIQKRWKNAYLALPLIGLLLSLLVQISFFLLVKKPVLFSNNSFVYYSILNQLPVFCVGISLYIAFKNGITENISKKTCISLFALFTSLSGFFLLYGDSFFIFSSALFPFLSALSYVFLFILLHNSRFKHIKFISKIGKISYSSYLVHFIFTFYFVTYTANVFSFLSPDILLILLFIPTVFMTYLSATFVDKYIEIPGTKLASNIVNKLNKENRMIVKEKAE